MKLNHGAALALVVYLMVPPTTDVMRFVLDPKAPSRWAIMESFDTAKECESARVRYQKPKDAGPWPQNMEQLHALKIFYSQCIASDDPRLREK